MSTTPVVLLQTGPVNSTSYADVAGMPFGLDRLPGETSDQYLDRLARASVETRTHVYEGLVSELAFQLGLLTQPGIRITGPADTTISCDLCGLALVEGATSLLCPLETLDEDEAWSWKSLSSIVTLINASNLWQAQLLVPDGPAVQLCRQTNAGVGMPYECVVSEVGLIGFLEPSLPTIAATPTGGLAYQVREFLQTINQIDRSYWSR
jgi:hypothetical protein